MNYPWLGGNTYEEFMGRWSSLAAGKFLKWFAMPPGLNWLDVGCGTGRYSVELANNGAKVTAIDFCKPMLEVAKQNAGELDIRFVYADLNKIPLTINWYTGPSPASRSS